MKEQHFSPIKTQLGTLIGRDAIYLNSMFYDGGDLIFEGNVNGHLASIPTNDNVFYRLTFSGVMALKMIELDSLYHLDPMSDISGDCSSFDQIINSQWIAELGGKVTAAHKHYHFGTYDDIFEVVCEDYELNMWTTKPFSTQKG